MLKLPAPHQVIPCRDRNLFGHQSLRLRDEAAEISSSNVAFDHDPTLHILSTDLRRPAV